MLPTHSGKTSETAPGKSILTLLILAAAITSLGSRADDGGNVEEDSRVAAMEAVQGAGPLTEEQTALALGRRVLAVSEAIRNPAAPGAMEAITDLGHDQRYYVMVRGWLSYQLQGDMSVLQAGRGQPGDQLRMRIEFLREAIRALDLE